MIPKSKWTIFLSTTLMLSVLVLSSCGYQYKCGVTFGSSSCNSSGSGLGTTSGSGASAAFAYSVAFAGSVNGATLTSGTSQTIQTISGFTTQTVPSSEESAEIVVVPKKFVYAVFPSSNKLYAWTISAGSGNLTPVSGSPYTIASLGFMIANSTGVNLSSMVVNPAGTMLFLAYAGSDQIDVYQIGSTGALTQIAGAPFSTLGTIQPWNLAFDGQGNYLYVTSGPEGLGGSVAAYSVSPSGAITAVQGSPFAFDIWQLQGDPSGKFMFGISGKSNALNGQTDDTNIYVFNIQQSGTNAGALSAVTGSPFATAFAPVNLAVQPASANGNFVYSFSVNLLGPNPIEGYQFDSTTGALTVASGSPFSTVGTAPWGQFDQSGTYLFIFESTSTVTSLGALNVASGNGGLSEPTAPLRLDATTYFAVTDAP